MTLIPPELDTGSYLGHYGIRNPWTRWLLARAPELVGMRPSVLRTTDVRPRCPDVFCRHAMNPRPEGWACYRHPEPMRRKRRLEVPKIQWAPDQPSALSLVGKEVDLRWDPEQHGYVIIVKEDAP